MILYHLSHHIAEHPARNVQSVRSNEIPTRKKKQNKTKHKQIAHFDEDKLKTVAVRSSRREFRSL